MSLDAYLEMEWPPGLRYEYINGVDYAMAGGAPRHGAIQVNLTIALGGRLRGTPCRPTSSDQRLFVTETDSAFYPDLAVVCGGYEADPRDANAVTNPRVIFEVLSPTSEDYDRGAKFARYRQIHSLVEYVLVHQDEQWVEHYRRNAAGKWELDEYREGAIELPSLDVALPFVEVYDLAGVAEALA